MDEYREKIKESIKSLSDSALVLFGLLCCERMLPNYIYFNEKNGWGDVKPLQEGLDIIIDFLHGENITNKQIEELQIRINKITPDTEIFDTILVSFALDACTSIYETLSFIREHNIESIVDVALFARDTVDMFIQVKESLDYNDPEFESKISSDIFMIKEKNRQKEQIQKLSYREVTSILITDMRSINFDEKIIDNNLIKNK